MRGKILFLTIILLLLSPALTYASGISAGVTYNDLDLSGKLKSDGTEIDLETDLSIEGDEPIGINVRLDLRRHHFWFDYTSVEFKGSTTVAQQFEFRNKTYTANADVDSELAYDLWELQYHNDLLKWEGLDSAFFLSPLVKVNLYDASASIKSSSLGFDESYSESLPLPTFGLLCGFKFKEYVEVSVQANGIGYSGDTYLEYKAQVGVKPFKYLNLAVGYKEMDIDYADEDNLLDFGTEGFFGQASFGFSF